MKKLYIIVSFTTLLLLASCSSSTSDMHSMDDGSNMEGVTHEESQQIKEKIMPTETKTQENKTPTEIDEESVVGDGSTHSMDDGTNMEGASHEESENHIEGDTHGMDDGSEMQGSSHSEGM